MLPEFNLGSNKSFTLIELIIVIAILGILAAAVVIVIDPPELLAEARDAQRFSDLDTLSKTITLYQSQSGSLPGNANTVYISIADTSSTCGDLGLPALSTGYTYACSSDPVASNGTGWIPINLSSNTSNSLASLPVDPTNATSTGLYYSYTVSGNSYELTALLESQKYRNKEQSSPSIQDYPGVVGEGTSLSISPLFNVSGLVGYWNFQEGTGTTAYDFSGNSNNGTWAGNLINGSHYTGGKIGTYAGNFDGSTDDMSFPTTAIIPDNDSMTVAAWVYLTSNPSDRFIGRWYGSSNNGRSGSISFTSPGSGYAFFVMNASGTTAQASSGNTNMNQWVYVTGVWDQTAGEVYMYVNGSLAASTALAGPSQTGTLVPTIMNSVDSSNIYTSGMVDDLRVYERALSPAEVKALYNAEH